MARFKQYVGIREMSQGLNTRLDPRSLPPNASPFMKNIDITQEGAITTRFGYEEAGSASGISAGGISGLHTFYKTGGTPADFLVIVTEGEDGSSNDTFHFQPANPTWSGNTIGNMGDSSDPARGIVFEDRLTFSNGIAANSPKSWDGTTFATATNVPDFNVIGSYKGFIFLTNPATPSVADFSDDITDWTAGTNGQIFIENEDGSTINGYSALNEKMVVLKDEDKYGITFLFNDSAVVVNPQQIPFRDFGGCIAPETVVEAFTEVYSLGRPTDGFLRFGETEAIQGGNPITQSLSKNIQPTVETINGLNAHKAAGVFFEKRYITTAPVGTNQINNNGTFIYFWDLGAWGLYDDIPASHYAVFRNAQKKDELYFGHVSEPKIFKFNTSYSDDGGGYERTYRTKIFTLPQSESAPITYKRFGRLDVAGALALNTVMTVKIIVDGVTEEYTIDSTNLITSPTGQYIGESSIGEAFVGGEPSDVTTPLFRFEAHIPFKANVNVGREVQFEFTNDAEGQGWLVDFYGFDFEHKDQLYHALNTNV